MGKASLESTDENENAPQYEASPPNAKKEKRSNEIELQNCFKNCSKSRTEKNVEFDCRENMNNFRHVTGNCDLFNRILALKLSISGKHFIRSDEPLSDKIMNAIISKFNDLIILYSKEGHSH